MPSAPVLTPVRVRMLGFRAGVHTHIIEDSKLLLTDSLAVQEISFRFLGTVQALTGTPYDTDRCN